MCGFYSEFISYFHLENTCIELVIIIFRLDYIILKLAIYLFIYLSIHFFNIQFIILKYDHIKKRKKEKEKGGEQPT